MLNRIDSFKTYILAAVFVTSLAILPVGSGGSVFAQGAAPDESTNDNITTVNEEADQEETASSIPNSGLILIGDRGQAVTTLQSALNDQGFSLNVDGVFGSNTDHAVRGFQKNNGIAVDGIVGPETKEALNSATHTEIEKLGNSEDPNQQKDYPIVDLSSYSQSDIVSIAQNLVGSPYQFGGTTPTGFDSSGFINYVFSQVGIPLERTHTAMWANNGTHVDGPSIGDVVFFENTYKGGVSHSGLYIGNNQMIHAGTEATGVEITSLNNSYWQERYIGAKSFQ
ncbi:NlpC/P60 family protein [Niallia sp. Krafla_26]|uniref:C40 family peptidase n=1 Tax=Niallia sp. Krafla_26 TaxID=3064703 RepID=UPI003D184A9C